MAALLKGTPINCLAGSEPPPVPAGQMPFVKLDPAAPPEGVVLLDGVWPRVLPAEEEDAALAGATGGPWVDSNARPVRVSQINEPAREVWLTYESPAPKEVVPPEEYVRAVAEPRVYGARWVIALDDEFAGGLAARNDRALGAWRQMMAALKYFEDHPEWKGWQPVATLTVISTFQGDAQLLAEEFLNLAPRRHLAHRVIKPADVAATSLEGQKALLYLEADPPPEGPIRTALLRFAENGGTVFAPRGIVSTQPVETRLEHAIYKHGRGRVITSVEKWEDPFALARQIHLLVSIREDVVQVWNGGDMNSHFLSSQDGKKGVVHLIPYAAGPTEFVTIGLQQAYRSARVTTAAGTTAAKITKGALGIEIPVGEISCFAVVELDA